MPAEEWYDRIHERLLVNDPTAPAELVEEVFESLVRRIQKKHPRISDPHLVSDAVTDALMDYIKNPRQFDPKKLNLHGFLMMAADRDLRNSLAKIRRYRKGKLSLETVEQRPSGGNKNPEGQVLGGLESERIRTDIAKLLSSRELRIFNLMVEGVRATAEYAKVLKIDEQPIREQRREVKRAKDRIKKRLRRSGLWNG